MSDQSRTRVVGWGPFRLPGERRRRREARERAVAELLLARSLSGALDGEPEAIGDEDGPS